MTKHYPLLSQVQVILCLFVFTQFSVTKISSPNTPIDETVYIDSANCKIELLQTHNQKEKDNVLISGHFRRDDDSPIENAKAFCLACSPTDLKYSDTNGLFEFTDIPLGGDYFILPEKEGSFVEGVTILDIVKMRTHILGIAPLSTTRALAADINSSGGITTFDVVIMRKLILGIDTTLSSSPSWVFQPNGININNLDTDKTDADFVGIKMGDVVFEYEVPTVNAQTKFIAQPTQVAVGSDIDLAIKVEGFTNVQGFQFGLRFDPSVLSLNDISSLVLTDVNSAIFHEMEPGLVNIVWLNQNNIGTDLADGSEALALNFSVLDVLQNDMPLTFDFSYVPPQVVLGGCELVEPIFEDGTIQVGTSDFESLGIDVSLMPNPIFQNQLALLEFQTEYSQGLTIEVLDTHSRILSKSQANIQPGNNYFELPTPEKAGVYFVIMTTQENITKTLKLIVL